MSKEVYNRLPIPAAVFFLLFSIFLFLLASIHFCFLFLTHANTEGLWQ